MAKRMFPMKQPNNKGTGQAEQTLGPADLPDGDYALDNGHMIYRKKGNSGFLIRQYRFLAPRLKELTIEKCEAKFPLGQIIIPPTH